MGAIGVVELKEEANLPLLQQHFIDEGVWIRPFRNLVYVTPPYICDQFHLAVITQAIVKTLGRIAGQ